MHLIVNVGQVTGGGTLSHAAELIVHGTVAEAHPTFVGSQIWNGNAAQVSANSGGADDGRVTGIRDHSLGLFVELGGLRKSIGLLDLRLGQTADEDHFTIPGSLKNLTRRQLRDVQLLVGISDVSVPGDHLLVEAGNEGLDTKHVGRDDKTLYHIHAQ